MLFDLLIPWVIAAAAITWLVIMWQNRPPEPPALPPPPVVVDRPYDPAEIIVSVIDIGILFVNGDGIVLMHNPAASELLNLQRDGVGRTLISLIRDHQFDEFVRDVALRCEADEMLLPMRNPARTLRVSARPIIQPDDDVIVILLIRDITQLSQLERSRRDMIASVSHELRTPLAALKLLSETIASNPPPEIAQRMARRISDEVDALTRLVNDLHDLSQIEAGRIALQMSPTDVIQIVERAIERIQPQADSHHIEVNHTVLSGLPMMLADAGRIDQVLLNLLHNAVKFTPDGGYITIGAQLINLPHDHDVLPGIPIDHNAGEWVAITVTDTGVGIPSEHLPRVFERFYKVDQARTRGPLGRPNWPRPRFGYRPGISHCPPSCRGP